ncbi:MAG TPA: hypothetical protein VHB72_01895 [Candidatus Saccharimonadales bacterium]|nr:hypothetical protein [Candidatus Saccharimonadales bacterium]
MKLVFKIEPQKQPLEYTLAAAKYERTWMQYQASILSALHKHTGLRFKQRRITVRMWEGASRAGNKFKPMELSVKDASYGDADVLCTIAHELAHRLVIGNGIEPLYGGPKANYYMHRHIYLFLYDVLVDVAGKAVADGEVRLETEMSRPLYGKAWRWALAMTYEERQATFARLKKRYKAGSASSTKKVRRQLTPAA